MYVRYVYMSFGQQLEWTPLMGSKDGFVSAVPHLQPGGSAPYGPYQAAVIGSIPSIGPFMLLCIVCH